MRVLSSKVVEEILNNLSVEDVICMQDVMESALKEYKNDPSTVPPRHVSSHEEKTHLFMPSTGSNVGIKTITGSKHGFKGATLIIDPIDGQPLGLVDAKVTTAFRTALCSTLPLVKVLPRKTKDPSLVPSKIVVYGAGLQAYWHIKLTILLYPGIEEVIICNRSLQNASELCATLCNEYLNVKITPLALNNEAEIKKSFTDVSIVYGCLPTTSPSISQKYIDEQSKSQKKLYISVIGSYKPYMTEVDGQVIKDIIESGGKIIVDSKEHASSEAGELIQNGVSRNSLTEVYDFINCSNTETITGPGNVILCKLVGLSIMDIYIGAELLRFSEKMNKGVSISF